MFLIYSLRGGGAERVLVDAVNHLDREKYEITLQTLFHDEAMYGLLDREVHYKTVFRIKNDKIKKLVSGFVQYVMPPSVVYRLFFRGDYDVEVAFMEAFPTKILAYSSNPKAKKYTWVHIDMNTYVKQDQLYRSLEHQKQCYEKFDGIYCVAEGVKEAFIQKFGLTKNVGVVYNILNEKLIEKKKNAPCPDFVKSTFTMITVGSLIERKGFARLIQICGKLKAKGYSFQLLLLGSGPLEDSLRQQVEELSLQDCVRMMGFQKNPYAYMARSDLYVCPSYVEGFSTVVSEAVILGLPVVTTESSGMREILGDSEYGLITENHDEALYEGLRKILSDPDLYRHYCQKVRERSAFFQMETRIREYEKILDQ
jgi:glycosyltransferase involved in cell wall biosynthesis